MTPHEQYAADSFPKGRRLNIEGYPQVFVVNSTNYPPLVSHFEVHLKAEDSYARMVYYPNAEAASKITFLPYRMRDFPKGTVIEVQDGSRYTVIKVDRSRSEPESMFSVHVEDGVFMPNRPLSKFRHIISRPTDERPQDAPVVTLPYAVGDLVEVTINIPGITGSTTGTVYHIDSAHIYVRHEKTGKNSYFSLTNEDIVIKKYTPSWEETLKDLPVKSFLKRNYPADKDFLVKISERQWAGVLNGAPISNIAGPFEDIWQVDTETNSRLQS